jgi:HlyD family secretion protein
VPGNEMIKRYILLFGLFAISIANVNAAVKIIQPYKGSIQQSFTELARTRLAHVYEINMPISGKLKRITLQEGDSVKQGQIVAQLEQKPLIQEVNKIQGDLETFKNYYNLQIKTLYRHETLGKKGFIDQQTIDQDRSYRDMAAAQIAKSEAALVVAKYNLKESTVYSPIDGTILNRYTEGGMWLREGTQLLQIGDLKDLEVICDILTQDAQLLNIGDSVLFSSIGSPVILYGKIKRIYPAGFTKKSSLGVDEQRVNVISSIDNPESANLGVDYRLQAEFLVGSEQKDALIVPRFSVLQDNQGQYYVFKVRDKRVYKQIIQIGIKTDTEISVIKGLTINDKIVAQPTAGMRDGMKI